MSSQMPEQELMRVLTQNKTVPKEKTDEFLGAVKTQLFKALAQKIEYEASIIEDADALAQLKSTSEYKEIWFPFQLATALCLLGVLGAIITGYGAFAGVIGFGSLVPLLFIYLWSNLQAQDLKGEYKVTRIAREQSVYQQSDQLELLIRTLPNMVAESSQELILQSLTDAKKIRDVLPDARKNDLGQVIYNQVAAGFLMKEIDEYLVTRDAMIKGLNVKQQAAQADLSAKVNQSKTNLTEHIQQISLLMSALRADILVKQEKELITGPGIKKHLESLGVKNQEIEIANNQTRDLLQGI